jgi:hypothetical protein
MKKLRESERAMMGLIDYRSVSGSFKSQKQFVAFNYDGKNFAMWQFWIGINFQLRLACVVSSPLYSKSGWCPIPYHGEFNLYPQSIDRKNSIFHGKAFSHFLSSPTQLSTVAFALSNMSKKCFILPSSNTHRGEAKPPCYGGKMCSTKNYTVYRHINTALDKKWCWKCTHNALNTIICFGYMVNGGRCRLTHAHSPSILL